LWPGNNKPKKNEESKEEKTTLTAVNRAKKRGPKAKLWENKQNCNLRHLAASEWTAPLIISFFSDITAVAQIIRKYDFVLGLLV